MYYNIEKLREIALNNGHAFHVGAYLIRGKSIIRRGVNSSKTHPGFGRVYRNGQEGYHLHAEMDVLRFAKPGDTIVVVRFSADGEITMARPCEHCRKFIKEKKIKRVFYTDWNGELQSEKPRDW